MGRKDLLLPGTTVYVVYPEIYPRFLIDAYFIRVDGDMAVCADSIDGFVNKYPLCCCFLTLPAADAHLKRWQRGGQA